ncbi:hypothetical protein C8J56DRAFT_1021349 [Mycena floridula]|nr:hypothetical protein C8J56DRAFT_1021349 [Mycena floridula]
MFQSSSPLHFPSSPLNGTEFSYKPINSSPLASPRSAEPSSPMAAVQARRRSQYKSRTPIIPLASSTSRNTRRVSDPMSSPTEQSQQSSFIRKRFEKRCMQRLKKGNKAAFSDEMDEDDDDEETPEDVMGSEFFRRMVAHSNNKQRYNYKRSMQQDFGSSFDPDMEDPVAIERELQNDANEDLTPDEIEAAELQAYVDEFERQQALADFEDLPPEILFGDDLSDDVDMDMDMVL